ncbi:MAG: flagellar basal body-associated FliL family protein [Pseudomonadota bacterium]
MKKKKGKPAAPAAMPGPDAPSSKSGGKGAKLLAVAAPLLVFGASFGASYVMGGAPVPAAPAPAPAPAASDHSADWRPPSPAQTVALETMIITAGPRGQTLRIGLALEMWESGEVDVPRMRDAFTTYLRALEPGHLSDPAYHVRMKRALLHRARVVAGQDAVADVLITDFLLTS